MLEAVKDKAKWKKKSPSNIQVSDSEDENKACPPVGMICKCVGLELSTFNQSEIRC